MNRRLKKVLIPLLICCLMFGLMHTALAAETFITSDNVNFRTEASTDSSVIMTTSPGAAVEVFEHDPAGWSKVKIGGLSGYMSSEYLTLQPGAFPATFITTDGVNFRTGPSLDAGVIKTVVAGSGVEVLEHDPAGWSKVKVGGTVGYIKSEYLRRPVQNTTQGDAASRTNTSTESTMTLWTSANVNFRTGPSLDADVIRTLSAGTAVAVIEHNNAGWSKVNVGGTVGYISSEFLSSSIGNVELLNWSTVKNIIKRGSPIQVIDVRTGSAYIVKCFAIGQHADVETPTQADTDILKGTYGGTWSWSPRPVWVTIEGRTIAAAMTGMPHDVSTISGNGIDGHLCLHFLGSKLNNGLVNPSTEAKQQEAVMEAFNAAS